MGKGSKKRLITQCFAPKLAPPLYFFCPFRAHALRGQATPPALSRFGFIRQSPVRHSLRRRMLYFCTVIALTFTLFYSPINPHKHTNTMIKYNVIPFKKPGTETILYRAQITPGVPIKVDALAEEISNECTVTVHDVKAVLSALDQHITSALLNGHSVRLGDLGSFHITLRSNSTPTRDEFTVDNITSIGIQFVGSREMRYELSPASPRVNFQQTEPNA